MKKFAKYLDLVLATLALVALVMIFLPAIVFGEGDFSVSYNGIKTVFGYKEKTLIGSAEILGFSFMNLLTYLLVIAACVCGAVSSLKKNKLCLFVAIVAAIVAAIFFFCTVPFCATKIKFSLGAGPIIGGICMILAAAAGVVKFVFGK